jgi:hypothetical protein
LKAAVFTTMTMEHHLFSPRTRLNDLLESKVQFDDSEDEELRQDFENVKELKLAVSTQELRSAETERRGFAYADMYAMLGNGDTIAWFTPSVYIVRADGKW